MLELIRELGYVQIDTISVIERAHHHTIWSRIESYEKNHLDELLASDRLVFEHWGHAASYLPMEDYRFSLPRMKRFPDTSSWERKFFEKHKHILDDILQRIRVEGALGASAFDDNRPEKPAYGWESAKPAKVALELLFWKGELMVTRRKGFQRIYDLSERVLPDWVNITYPSLEELYRHYALRSLKAMGIATLNDIQNHFMVKGKEHFKTTLHHLIENKEVVKTGVEGSKEEYFMLQSALDYCCQNHAQDNELYFLSPFDNLVILRPRIKRLFNFDYTIECYVTPHKRIYGYWSLPVLFDNSLIGRIDCKADRKSKTLIINSLHWEKQYLPDHITRSAFQTKLKSFATFNGCQEIKWLRKKDKFI